MLYVFVIVVASFFGAVVFRARQDAGKEKAGTTIIRGERKASASVGGFTTSAKSRWTDTGIDTGNRAVGVKYHWPDTAISIVSEQGLSIGSGETQGDFNTRMAVRFQESQRLLDEQTGYLQGLR